MYTLADITLRGQEDRVEVRKGHTGFFALSGILNLNPTEILVLIVYNWCSKFHCQVLKSAFLRTDTAIYTSFIYHCIVLLMKAWGF